MSDIWKGIRMNTQKKLLLRGAVLAAAVLGTTSFASAAQTVHVPPVMQILWASRVAQEEDWKLMLVNPWNTVPEGYQPELKALSNGLQVDERIYDALTEMLADCRAAGLNPIVCSAYRTEETQTRLFETKISRVLASGVPEDQARTEAARWVAPPGTSEHQTGLAVDLVAASYQILDEAQEDTAEQKWLMENCWKYGFILRYPTEKSEITGIGYEPWHYRYVGQANAAAMHRTGECLEEYLQRMESLRNQFFPEEAVQADTAAQPDTAASATSAAGAAPEEAAIPADQET